MTNFVKLFSVPVLASAVAGLGFATYQLSNYAVDVSPLASPAETPAGSGVTVAAKSPGGKDGAANVASPARTLTEFAETTTRPIFFSGRRVPEKPKIKVAAVEAKLAAPVAPPAPPPDPLRLVGIMGASNTMKVLVRTSVDPQGIWLSVGDEYRGWKLREVSADNAVVEALGQRTELRLYASASSKNVKR